MHGIGKLDDINKKRGERVVVKIRKRVLFMR